MKQKWWMCLLVTFLFLPVTDALRVIMLPMPYTSHTKYHTNIARELTKAGHDVWLTMPDYIVAKGVLDISNFTVIEYSMERNIEEEGMLFLRDKYFKGEEEDFNVVLATNNDYTDKFLRNETFLKQIKSLDPEFIIIDNVLLKAFTVIPYRLGVPFAFVGSAFDPVAQRVPFFPTINPLPLFTFTDRMTFLQRTVNVLLYTISIFVQSDVRSDAVAVYAPEMPFLPIDRLVARAEIWLAEVDHILDYPKPSLPSVKLIGGTATGPAKPLNPKFQSFMDAAIDGVVIVSFGSYVLSLPQALNDKIFEVLLQLPFKSVFRSTVTSPDPSKILTSSWLPQNDLLGHPNTKVFVSHCGKNGQYEALYHAVPVVSNPMFADQPYNAERMRVKGFSETIDLRSISTSELRNVILKVATNSSYKQAITKAASLFRAEMGVPMEIAGWWLDHVMRNGGGHLRSAGHDMPYYQLLGVDVWAFVLSVMLAFVTVLVSSCYLLLKCLCCQSKLKKE